MAPSSSRQTPSIAFQNALDKFTNSLTEKQKLEFAVTKYEDVEDAIEQIQQQYGEKKELQNMYRIQSFLEAMNEYGKVVEVFLNCTPFVAYIWGPVKFVLQVASSWSDSLDILLSAYEDIGERAPSFLRYRLLFERNPPMRDMLEKWYCDVLQFHSHALQFLTRPRWKQLFKSSWKVFNSNFKRILDSLQRHKDIIEGEKSSLTVYEIQTLRDDEAARFNETRLDRILDKINAPNCYLDQETSLEHRENSHSGKWVLDHEKFKQWRNAPAGSNPLLYIHGIPGAGKTTLASVIIETLCAARQPPTLYFYCRHRQEGKDSFIGILRGLLAQILSVDQSLATFFSDKYSDYDKRRFETANAVKEAADDAFSCQRISYVVLDGLDECDPSEAEKVISWFTSRQRQAPLGNDGHIRLLCLGQRTDLLQRMLSGAQDISLDTQQRHKEDIECYIRGKIQSISADFSLDPNTQNNIVSKVSTVANGMFLYSKVVMDNLACQYTLDQLMEELAPGVFPDGLDDAYKRVVSTVLNKAPPRQRRAALQILGWVTCATRPLKWREIQATFFIDPETSTSQYEGRRLRGTCKKFCSSLVDLHVGAKGDVTEATLGLVHSTAREYLINTDTIDLVAQNFSLALFCSQYLLSAPFRKTIDNSKIQEYAHSGYYALQDYAVSSIFAHFHATFEDGMGDKQVSSVEFHSSLQLFISEYGKALRLKMSTANTFSAPPELHHQLPSDPVKRYALFDLERRTSLIRNVLEGVRNDDSLQHERKMTLKAIYGPETYKCPRPWCVHFLNGLDTVEDRERHIHRHDSPFICPDEQCPFHQIGFDTEASLNRHITQYHSLIQADSQTTFPQPRPTREDTLCAAAERGDLNSVQKHIDDGAIVNKATRPNGSRTPLYLAAQNGHLAICDLLIRHGANIHSGSGPWRLNALTTAIKNGKEDIVRYLLNTKTLLVGRPTPLECAAAFHRLGMLKCVIDKLGSQLAPFELGYALRMASERGNVELAMLLIELLQSRFTDQLSATINWQGDGFHRWTHPALVTSLTRPIRWDNGKATTEIDTTHTPLHVAARNGHHSLVQLLLDIQADPSPAYILPTSRDLAGPTWATPLYDAAQNGHTEVVRLLLEADADPNEQCGFMAPLHIAAQKGHAKIVGLILDSGKVSMDAISLFKVAIRGNVNIPALHMLTLAKEIDPPATIEVGAVHCESNGVASEWYTFSNPDVQKVIEIDLLQNFDFEAEYHIRSITFSEDGRYLAASTDNSVDVYDAISSHQIGSIDISASELADGPLEHLCFSPDGSHLLGTFRATLWLWNISTSVSSSCSSWHEGTINAVAYTPDGRSVLTGSTDRTIRMWDISGDGQPMHIHTLKLDHGATSFAVSPDDQYLVIGDMAGNIWLWDMNSRATFASQLSHGVGSFKGKIKHLSFYLDGRYLVCHQESQPIQSLQWMPRSSRNDKPGLGKLATLPCRGESEGFRGSCVTADQQWLLSRQCLGKIFIQNATHGKVQAVLQTHAENVCSLVCSRAGCVFATASDNQVRVWKMREI